MGASESAHALNASALAPWEKVERIGGKKQGDGAVELERRGGNKVFLGGHLKGHKKDQDRFVWIPDLLLGLDGLPSVVLGCIFDGHGRDGDICAEQLVEAVPKQLRAGLVAAMEQKQREHCPGKLPDTPMFEKQLIETALSESFTKMQERLDDTYEKTVVVPMMKLKEEIEATQKVPLGEISLPAGSGSTATLLLLISNTLFVANVGDSRAVLVTRDRTDDKCVIATDLTDDHNVQCADPEEIARIESLGGSIYRSHILGTNVDGGLELTRSLGDIPLHRQQLVEHDADVRSFDLSSLPDKPIFAFAASDGLYAAFSSQQASEFLMDRITTGSGPAHLRVLEACKQIEAAAYQRVEEKGRSSDDISIIVLLLEELKPK